MKEIITNCSNCTKKLIGKQKKYCSTLCKNAENNNKFQNYKSQQIRGKNRKIDLVKKFGGKCSKCGYNKNYAALCFHHLHDKSFRLDSRSLSNRTLKSIENESSKCQLLCHNCHMEIHYPHMDVIFVEKTGCTKKVSKAFPYPNDIDELQKRLLEGSVREVASIYNVTDTVIHRWVKELKLKKPKKYFSKKVTWATKDDLKKLLWKKKITNIAEDYNTSPKTIRRWVDRYDLKIPPIEYWNAGKIVKEQIRKNHLG